MPSYTTMNDLATSDLVTEADMDAMRGNIDYVLSPNCDRKYNNAANLSVASATFVALSAANASGTVVTYGGRLRIHFGVRGVNSTVQPLLDIWLDGVQQGDATVGMSGGTIANGSPFNFSYPTAVLSAGTHTVEVRAKGTATFTFPTVFEAWEG